MTDCRKILREIEFYLDNELDEARCGQIRAHLDACSECMDRTEFRVNLRRMIARKCGCEEMPAELVIRVRAEIERSSEYS